jgi:hypothetical protein
MMMCYQLFCFGDEIREFKDRRYLWDAWGKTRDAYRVLVEETEGSKYLEIPCSVQMAGKGKFHPITCYEVQRFNNGYTFTFSLTSALVGRSTPLPGRIKGKINRKVHPRTGHEGPEVE